MSQLLLPSQKPLVPYLLIEKPLGEFCTKVSGYVFVPTGTVMKVDAYNHTRNFSRSKMEEFDSLPADTILYLGEWFTTDVRVDDITLQEYGEYIKEDVVRQLFVELGRQMSVRKFEVNVPYVSQHESPLEVIHEKLSRA